MGIMEENVKDKIRATKIQRAILGSIAAVGILSVALLAPNALQMLKLFDLDKKLRLNKVKAINTSRQNLIIKGLVKYEDGFLCLTKLGEKTLKTIELSNYKIRRPVKWDGKWRMLVFDIKESQRTMRDKVRNTLVSIGFVRLQNSVWVYPYDCEDLITLIKADMMIGREVLYVIADRIENDKDLLSFFGLKPNP